MGFNRASFGVQDFDKAVQLAINREQSIAETLRAIAECRAAGFRSVNLDLIYGLPRQNLAGFRHTLDIIADARPDRVAVYGYAHLPQTFEPQRQIVAQDLPGVAARLDLLQSAIERLTTAGYVYIGLDYFALPDDELSRALQSGTLQRNFTGYTTHASCDLIGLGVSAISHVSDSFSQNHRELASWELAVDQGRLPIHRGLALDDDDIIRADIIQQLMCSGAVDRSRMSERHDIDFDEHFADSLRQLAPLVDDGLLKLDGERILVTSRGRLMLRIIAMCFDRYTANQSRHSRAL
jgi:oxygen-independent coproporphyrinogen-3 oxidase